MTDQKRAGDALLRLEAIEPTVFFARTEQGIRRGIDVTVDNGGGVVDAEIHLQAGAQRARSALCAVQPGTSKRRVYVPDIRESIEVAFTLLAGGTSLTEIALPALPAGSHQITVHELSTIPHDLTLVATLANRSQKRVNLPLPLDSEQYLPFGSGIIFLGATPEYRDSPPGTLRLHFAASYPIQRDYVVSASLIGLNPDGTWAWQDLDDGVPAMGAIPTLKWIAGSRITDPHRLAVPPDAPPGPVIGTLIIYDAFTGRPLPLLDGRLAADAPWAPLGEWTLRP